MHPWIAPLHGAFARHANPVDALPMEAYMKGIAPFFGIKAPARRAILKAHIAKLGPPPLGELPAIVRSAFDCPQRELHQTAVDLLMRDAKRLGLEHLPLVEELVTTKSWWDTVDGLAIHVAGAILKRHPEARAEWCARWAASDNRWLIRTAIIFQNRWKGGTDQALLFGCIGRHAAHPDFFIRKAIGSTRRELAATDPDAVRRFVAHHRLSALSVREALKHL